MNKLEKIIFFIGIIFLLGIEWLILHFYLYQPKNTPTKKYPISVQCYWSTNGLSNFKIVSPYKTYDIVKNLLLLVLPLK